MKWKSPFFWVYSNLIKPNMLLQTCCFERTEVGGQNALNAHRMNARGSCCQKENYWATMKRCFYHVLCFATSFTSSSLFLLFFFLPLLLLSFSAFFKDVIKPKKERKIRPFKNWNVFIKNGIQCFLSLSVLWVVSRWRQIAGDGWFTDILLFLFSMLSPVFFFKPLNSASVACLSSFHRSIPWQHELPLCVTVTWASASPHITAAFDWLGLSRSVSCCLIITLFDCWSRDVIDWSAHPVWG